MPKGEVPRYKEVRCRTCGQLIHRFDRSRRPDYKIPGADIMSVIRRHYRDRHPKKFEASIQKGIRTRRRRRRRHGA